VELAGEDPALPEASGWQVPRLWEHLRAFSALSVLLVYEGTISDYSEVCKMTPKTLALSELTHAPRHERDHQFPEQSAQFLEV
jgi:hypothetical protein